MAIAELFHCKNIPDSTVESKRFKIMLTAARTIVSDFVIPSRRKIGGDLLELNYKNCYINNRETILSEASTVGLAFLSDGATVKQMPLMIVLVMCGPIPPIVAGIQDYTDHMASGGKKDETYIADIFEEKVKEFDMDEMNTNILYFDGAGNVHKVGQVMTAKFPWAYTLHGGEHVIALFFSSIAKLKPIKVSLLQFHLPSIQMIGRHTNTCTFRLSC